MNTDILRSRGARAGLALLAAGGLLGAAAWVAPHLGAGHMVARNLAAVDSAAGGSDSAANPPGSQCTSDYQPQPGYDLDVCISADGGVVTPSVNVRQLGDTGSSCVIVLEIWDDAGDQLDSTTARSVNCAVGQESGPSFDVTSLTNQTANTHPDGTVNVHAFARLVVNGSGTYIPGQGDSPAVTVPASSTPGCLPGDTEAGCHNSSFGPTLPTPPAGWIASSSDPVNLVIYDPSGHAADVLQAALMAPGTGTAKTRPWYSNTCYNAGGVKFTSDSGMAPRSPDASYSTDNGDGADVPGFTGCGTVDVVRDHLRVWKNSGNTIAWIAASDELPLSWSGAAGNGLSPHKVTDNGFNSGRDGLVNDLQAGLNAMGQVNGQTYTYTFSLQPGVYSCGGLKNPTNATATCDGNVALFAVSNQP